MSGPEETRVILPPYAQALGIVIDRIEGGAPVLACEGNLRIEGRTGFWHGGALSGLLEMAAFAAVQAHLGGAVGRLKPVNVTVQFLRSGLLEPTYAAGRVVRTGRRVANVTAEAWQDDRERLVATAQMQIILAERA